MSGQARLRVTGALTEGHSVPAEVLVRVLQALQQSILILGAAGESRVFRQRFKPDRLLRQRLTLRLSAAEPGSYAVPLAVVDEREQPSLQPELPVLEQLFRVWESIASDDLGRAHAVVPDARYFGRLLREMQQALPAEGEPWGLGFGLGDAPELELGPRQRETLKTWLAAPSEQREARIIGELIRVDFSRKSLGVLYPPTGREIECTYTDDLEEDLLAARRGPVQVTGRFVVGADSHPERLLDVSLIEPVILDPIHVSDLVVDGRPVKIEPTLVVTPQLDDEAQQTFLASVPEYCLELSGGTRSALFEDLLDQLRFVWLEYAEADPDTLTEDARSLRDALRSRMRWA